MLLKHPHHAAVVPHSTEAHRKLLTVMLYYMVIYFHYIKYSYNNSHLFCMPLTSLWFQLSCKVFNIHLHLHAVGYRYVYYTSHLWSDHSKQLLTEMTCTVGWKSAGLQEGLLSKLRQLFWDRSTQSESQVSGHTIHFSGDIKLPHWQAIRQLSWTVFTAHICS